METIKTKRLAGIDIIKCFAVLFVICVHFFMKTKYYSEPVDDTYMFLQSYLRWIFVTAVPLFILCTGFLEWKKEPTAAYYKKITRVIIPYVLISLILIFFNVSFFGKDISLRQGILSVFTFNANTYSWYVNMYIGLFLLLPVFNCAVKSLTQKQLKGIVISLIFLVAMPSFINPILKLHPGIRFISFPDWWKSIYPVMYYFTGAYIGKYRPSVRKAVLIPLVVFIPAFQTLLQMYLNAIDFDNYRFTDYSALSVYALSLCIFLLFYNVDIKKKGIKKIVKKFSVLTLEIYLMSNLTDKFVYNFFKDLVFYGDIPLTQNEVFTKYFVLVVFIAFSSAFVSALLFDFLYRKAEKVFFAIGRKIKKGKNDEKNASEEEADSVIIT